MSEVQLALLLKSKRPCVSGNGATVLLNEHDRRFAYRAMTACILSPRRQQGMETYSLNAQEDLVMIQVTRQRDCEREAEEMCDEQTGTRDNDLIKPR